MSVPHIESEQPMIVVYISGPYRAPTAWGIEQNIRKAEALALRVWKAGMVALCPHLNTRCFQGELPDSDWITGDLALVMRSDVVLMVEGWENSAGAKLEMERAKRHHIPVYTSLDDLSEWLAKQKPSSE